MKKNIVLHFGAAVVLSFYDNIIMECDEVVYHGYNASL